jgi:hypothetical protein
MPAFYGISIFSIVGCTKENFLLWANIRKRMQYESIETRPVLEQEDDDEAPDYFFQKLKNAQVNPF